MMIFETLLLILHLFDSTYGDIIGQPLYPDAQPKSPRCTGDPSGVGRCRALLTRYYWDEEVGVCKPSDYGGCGGEGGNSFKTEEECLVECRPEMEQMSAHHQPRSLSTKTCSGASDWGSCESGYQRYYYDGETGKCNQFIYSGCGGNGNNYVSEEECNMACQRKPETITKTCTGEFDAGPCRESVPRFYWDGKSGECKSFLYGGCGGNGNNYESLQACNEACKPVSFWNRHWRQFVDKVSSWFGRN